jgi:hypothetical protein
VLSLSELRSAFITRYVGLASEDVAQKVQGKQGSREISGDEQCSRNRVRRDPDLVIYGIDFRIRYKVGYFFSVPAPQIVNNSC